MLLDLRNDQRGSVLTYDVVFHYDPDADPEFPLHVGIYVGAPIDLPGVVPRLRVFGLPEHPTDEPYRAKYMGADDWGAPGSYHADMIGRRPDASRDRLSEIMLTYQTTAAEQSPLGYGQIHWNPKCVIDVTAGGQRIFKKGHCADFVEFLYEEAGLDIVNQERTFDQRRKDAVRGASGNSVALQIRAFKFSQFPLTETWRDSFARYPECLDP